MGIFLNEQPFDGGPARKAEMSDAFVKIGTLAKMKKSRGRGMD
jgi:hypothetical protein